MLIEGIYEPIKSIEFEKDGEFGINIVITFADGARTCRYVAVNLDGEMSYLD